MIRMFGSAGTKIDRGLERVGPSRGAALPTVLALVTVILVAGLAMGSLSTLSLQFNRRQLDRMSSELAAKGALAVFLSQMQENNALTTLNPLVPDAVDLSEVFKNPIVHEQDGYRAVINFNQQAEGHSVDNLAGELPKLGWPDAEVPKIPPYALDLIINVEGPSGISRYRAVLKRVWPFALYTSVGPVVLMGQPNPGGSPAFPMPSRVEGDVYTTWFGDSGLGGGSDVGYGFGPLARPSDLLANVEAREGFHPKVKPQHPLIIGLEVAENPKELITELDRNADEVLYKYRMSQLIRRLGDVESDPTFGPIGPPLMDIGNVLDGDFVYDHDKGASIGPSMGGNAGDNEMLGDILLKRGLALDPLAEMRKTGQAPESTFQGKSFTKVPFDPVPDDTVMRLGLDPIGVERDDPLPHLLAKTLRLTEADGAHFEIDGSVSNREVFYLESGDADKDGLYVREVKAGLELQGVVLHVKGDLDLGASQLDAPVPISGAGATLVVDGKLILGNAHIDAQDQGFVIYAKDIVLKGGGTFFGLMVASNSITILSQGTEPLRLEGALMCGGPGGVLLRGARVKHEPRYLKSINGGGDLALVSWTKLN